MCIWGGWLDRGELIQPLRWMRKGVGEGRSARLRVLPLLLLSEFQLGMQRAGGWLVEGGCSGGGV